MNRVGFRDSTAWQSDDCNQTLKGALHPTLTGAVDPGDRPNYAPPGAIIRSAQLSPSSSGTKAQTEAEMLRTFFSNPGQVLQLAKLQTSRKDIEALASQIAKFAPDSTKLEYVKALASQAVKESSDLQQERVGMFGSATTITSGSPEAVAIGTVIASLKGNAFDSAVDSLSSEQLAAVMKAAEHQTITIPPSDGETTPPPFTKYDTKDLVSIIDAAATGHDVTVKTRMFEASTRAIDDINKSQNGLVLVINGREEKTKTMQSVSHLLMSDLKIVNELFTDRPSGGALVTFAKELMEEGRTSDLAGFIKPLQQGGDPNQDPTEYLDRTANDLQGKPRYANAENLGYFVGSVFAAINKMSSSARARSDNLTNVLAAIVSGASAFARTPIKALVPGGAFTGRELLGGAFRDSTVQELREQVIASSLPQDPKTHRPVPLASGPAFKSAVAFVLDMNR